MPWLLDLLDSFTNWLSDCLIVGSKILAPDDDHNSKGKTAGNLECHIQNYSPGPIKKH